MGHRPVPWNESDRLSKIPTYEVLLETRKESCVSGSYGGKSKRRFRRDYQDLYQPWLCWSEELCGAFCKYCVIFAANRGAGNGDHVLTGALVSKPLKKFKDVKEVCAGHATKLFHMHAIAQADSFISIYEGKSNDVITQLNVGWRKQIEDNRQRLIPIIQTVHHCGKQGIALRGDDESGVLSLQEPIVNDGNFRACLRLRLQAGDIALKKHLESCPKNSHYMSWKIQNEIISVTGKLMRDVCVEDANASGFFSILCDGATDISVKEQMSVVARFVKNNAVHGVFLGLEELQATNGLAIADKLLQTLSSYGLDLEKLRGQGRDI